MPRMIPISERAKTPEERLMQSVLLQQIQDAVNIETPGQDKILAISYLFEDDLHSKQYVFGFRHICDYFGYDPKYFRQKIQELIDSKVKIPMGKRKSR